MTPADLESTICKSGWTTTVRPPESYTEPIKIQQMAAYGDTGSTSSYEEDHLIPLELGGSPTDPRNLWPEPGPSPNAKDAVEDAGRRAVCDGRIPLADAQTAIASDWMAFGRQLGLAEPTEEPSSPATSPAPAATTPPATTLPPSSASGCSPTTSKGDCYKAGEYCSDADHGRTGTDANGDAITCTDVGGTWRWQ